MIKLYWLSEDAYLLMLADEIVYGDKAGVSSHLGENNWVYSEVQELLENCCKLF